ncbi:MAG: universal stress protein [Alphaproteobacteria bacterium]|nr:universal stress protein [Alphaproteobacteria bacterium]
MFKSILLPVDLNQQGSWAKALPAAIELAQDFKAQLHLLSIVPDVGMSIVSQYLPKDFEKKAVGDAGAALQTFTNENVPAGLKAKSHVAHGVVRTEIVSSAEKLGCDLIVMAPHRPEVIDILISPKTNYVVEHFKGSVLVVRN